MKNKTVKGIIALAVVTALSFAVIIGSNQLSKNMTAGTQGETAEVTEELDVRWHRTNRQRGKDRERLCRYCPRKRIRRRYCHERFI